jgi:hypothetical protein
MVENYRLIPIHQYVFRQRHSTIEQTHRIVRKMNEAFEKKQYFSAAFLDISQACWTSVQVKTAFPSELFPYPEIHLCTADTSSKG